MTSKDDINMDDKDFDAFLQHEGELSQLLKKLPQPMPSADLDAAILAAAKAELEKNPAPQSVAQLPVATAANDAGSPVVARVRPGLIRRWRMPLGLAASLLVTVQLVRWQMKEEQTVPGAPAVLYESAPTAAPAPPPPPADTPAPSGSQDKVLGAVSAPAAQFLEEERRKAPPPPSKPQLEPQRSNISNRVANASGNVAAEAVAPPVMLQERAADSYARAPAPPPSLMPVAPQQYAKAIAVPPPAPAPAPAAMAAAPPASAVRPGPAVPEVPAQRVEITGTTIRRADTETASPVQVIVAEDLKKSGSTSVDGVITNPADTWLAKIDALLKAGSNQEALQEWRKFRKEYPDYVVPDDVNEKIKALDK
jgi:hypothetical protein